MNKLTYSYKGKDGKLIKIERKMKMHRCPSCGVMHPIKKLEVKNDN